MVRVCCMRLIFLGIVFTQADEEIILEESHQPPIPTMIFHKENQYRNATMQDTQNEVYKAVISGTCVSHGYEMIYDLGTCSRAAAALGYVITSGPHTGNTDVVDGCSVRYGDTLFVEQHPTYCTEQTVQGSCECRPFPHTCLCKDVQASTDISDSDFHDLSVEVATSEPQPSLRSQKNLSEMGVGSVVTEMDAPIELPTLATPPEGPVEIAPNVARGGATLSYEQPRTWEEVEALLQRMQESSQTESTHVSDEMRLGNDDGIGAMEQIVSESHTGSATSDTEEDVMGESLAKLNVSKLRTAERKLYDDPLMAEVDTFIMRPTSTAIDILLKLKDLPLWSGVQPIFLVPCNAPAYSIVIPPLEYDSVGLRAGEAVWVRFKNLEPSTDYCVELTDNLKATDFPSGFSFQTPSRTEL